MTDDLISREALRKVIFSKTDGMEDLWDTAGVLNVINNAPTVLHDNYSMGYQDGVKKVNSDTIKFNKIKALIDNWAVDDDEHELLEKISDIVNDTEVEDE